MEKIAVLVDSAGDLPLDLMNKKNIKLMPLRISYSSGEYRDVLEISADEIYENLKKEVPKTSLPSAQDIQDILSDLEKEGYTHIIAITISSGLSGTFNSVRLLLDDHPIFKSHVFDTKILAMPEGLVALEVANLVEKGLSFNEIVKEIPKIRERITGYFTINTLEYLLKGGRIGRISGVIGEILNLKPVVTTGEDGVYYTITKARGRKQSISKLISLLKEDLKKGKSKVWVLHADALDEALKIKETIKNLDNIVEVGISQISPALGVHGGPGLLGFAVQLIK